MSVEYPKFTEPQNHNLQISLNCQHGLKSDQIFSPHLSSTAQSSLLYPHSTINQIVLFRFGNQLEDRKEKWLLIVISLSSQNINIFLFFSAKEAPNKNKSHIPIPSRKLVNTTNTLSINIVHNKNMPYIFITFRALHGHQCLVLTVFRKFFFLYIENCGTFEILYYFLAWLGVDWGPWLVRNRRSQFEPGCPCSL